MVPRNSTVRQGIAAAAAAAAAAGETRMGLIKNVRKDRAADVASLKFASRQVVSREEQSRAEHSRATTKAPDNNSNINITNRSSGNIIINNINSSRHSRLCDTVVVPPPTP